MGVTIEEWDRISPQSLGRLSSGNGINEGRCRAVNISRKRPEWPQPLRNCCTQKSEEGEREIFSREEGQGIKAGVGQSFFIFSIFSNSKAVSEKFRARQE